MLVKLMQGIKLRHKVQILLYKYQEKDLKNFEY